MRHLIAIATLCLLTACGGVRDDLTTAPEQIGNFQLGFGLAVTRDPQLGPFSRRVDDSVWTEAMQTALQDRFKDRYTGSDFYHIGVSVDGYVLAQPGVPLIYSPKSVLIITVNFYHDATQRRLNPEPIQLTVFEPCCAVPFLSSGITRSAQEQLEGLTFNAARAVERTIRENADWFGGQAETLSDDPSIVTGNVLVDNPDAVSPDQSN